MVAYQGVDVDGADAVPAWIAMSGPQLFLGSGQIGLLGETLEQIYLKNDGATLDATVEILVGRDAEITGG
jgi:hypothetical protein